VAPVVFLLLAMPLLGLAARDAQNGERCADDQRVRAIRFEGSPIYDDVTLAASIATRAPTFAGRLKLRFGFGALPCSDSLGLELDGLRLAVLHRQAGWLQSVVSVLQDRSADGVRVRFMITPGPAAILDSIHVLGLPELVGERRPLDAPLRAREGERFDRLRFDEAVSSVVTRLRDLGYARAARPTVVMRIDSDLAGRRTDVCSGTRVLRAPSRSTSKHYAADRGFRYVPRLSALRAGSRYRAPTCSAPSATCTGPMLPARVDRYGRPGGAATDC
jgi:outer membrane protein insertion porin family/translocation and assembly module TamA